MKPGHPLLSTLLLLFSLSPLAATQSCSSEQHRAFDFWAGHWDVFASNGQKAGENKIEKRHGGCVLHEYYATDKGYSGESVNIFDASRGVWHQSWTDSSGLLLQLEGGLQGESMLMEGKTTAPNGQVLFHRITWTPNPDGSVRQHWQSKTTDGTWKTIFDGRYVKKHE